MTNHMLWTPGILGLAWVLGVSAFAGLVALSHKLKRQLRAERRYLERGSRLGGHG